VWALDFPFIKTADARVLKLLNITDEFTKNTLAIEVERSFTSGDMIRVLERLVTVHGTPTCVRMDNGTEMTTHTLCDWHRFTRCVTQSLLSQDHAGKTRTWNP